MVQGCFVDSIKELFQKHTEEYGAPYIKVLDNHEDRAAVLCYIEENEKGLYVEFMCLNTEHGRDFYVAIAAGALNQMSIGFIPLETRDKVDADGNYVLTPSGEKIRQITRCYLMEVSGVDWPANYGTSLGNQGKALKNNSCTHNENISSHATVTKSDLLMEEKSVEECCKEIIGKCADAIKSDNKLTLGCVRKMRKAAEMLYTAGWLCEIETPEEDDGEMEEEAKALKSFFSRQPMTYKKVEEEKTQVEKSEAKPPAQSDLQLGELKNLLSLGIEKLTSQTGGKG